MTKNIREAIKEELAKEFMIAGFYDFEKWDSPVINKLENLFRSWALKYIVPEEGIQWMQEGNHKVNEKGYTKGFNACRDLMLKKIEEATNGKS